MKTVDREAMMEQLAEYNCMLLEPREQYDAALIGVCERFGQEPIAAYDRKKVLEILIANSSEGMTWEEAEDFFGFNMVGAYVGEQTPCFVDLFEVESSYEIESLDIR